MQIIPILLLAAAVFGICYLVDKGFTRLFRNKAQHRSGNALRASKRYGSIGVILIALGIAAIVIRKDLRIPGVLVAIMGIVMVGYYLSYGIFYDEDSFLVSSFGKKERVYQYKDIRCQQLYIIAGGNVVVELRMHNGQTVSIQSFMAGSDAFLDTAFAGWCRQTGADPENCAFRHDPSQSCWFPSEEEV